MTETTEKVVPKTTNLAPEEITNKDLPIVHNINIGHSTPRCIIPFGVEAEVNVSKQTISFNY